MNGSKKRGPPKNGLELINSYEWMNKLALFFSQSQQNEIIKTSNILNDVRFFGNPDQNSSEPLHILPIFNESPILFNDVRFLSDSGFLFSSKKTLCWGHPNILLHWIYIKKHMVAYENNKYYGMMYIFVSHALFLRPTIDRFEIGLVWKWAYMLWKWQHLAILQKWLDLGLVGS